MILNKVLNITKISMNYRFNYFDIQQQNYYSYRSLLINH